MIYSFTLKTDTKNCTHTYSQMSSRLMDLFLFVVDFIVTENPTLKGSKGER